MVANDDLEGKTTHFTDFYTHTISGPNIPKPPIMASPSDERWKHRFLLLVKIIFGL